jgi:hypothetical protein
VHSEAMFHIFKSFHDWRDGRSHFKVLEIEVFKVELEK